ncbi:uncharacterized protein LOC113350119 [Papaver somniferum]|uniref:uncharacterized protein LOC113350119 n=1 Tax=Papaver somniferum TaxID=3469 RepID=UPI000E6FA33A|nr:uncharacterized protein LOC113350119 [Papaver somniferum]
MVYLLDYENDFTQTQFFSQAQDDDFMEPNAEDEYMDEEPNANNTQTVPEMETMEDQPPPVDVIHEDTKYHFQTDLTWKTKEEAVKWAEEHGWKINCVLVKGRQSRKERVEMVYERYGKKIWIVVITIHVQKDLHGHYRAGRLKAHEYAEVDKITRAHMPPSKILSKLKADDKNNKTMLKQIYNARSTLRRKDLQGRLVMQQLLCLAQKKNYACQKKLDEFGHVTHLFIAHPECVKLELCFPQVLILDCTYKTNKYEMPLMNIVGHTSTIAMKSLTLFLIVSIRQKNDAPSRLLGLPVSLVKAS